MLVRSKELVHPFGVNIIVLEDKEGYYYYVHRSVYDDAVILQDRYSTDVERLLKVIGRGEDITSGIDLFTRTVPKPLSILGYFLKLIEEDLDDINDMCGALHVMSLGIGFRKFTQAMDSVKSQILYSISIKDEYKIYWDRIFKEYSLRNDNIVTSDKNVEKVDDTYSLDTTGDPRTNENHEFYMYYKRYPNMPLYENLDDMLNWIDEYEKKEEAKSVEEYNKEDDTYSEESSSKKLLAKYFT